MFPSLLLLISGAQAQATLDPLCDSTTLPPGAVEACRCMFEYSKDDPEWTGRFEPGFFFAESTCYEYQRVLNPVPTEHWYRALNRLNAIGDHHSCQGLWFTHHHEIVFGLPPHVASDSVLETMMGSECSNGNDLSELAKILDALFHVPTRSWRLMLGDLLLAQLAEREGFTPQSIWLLNDDDDEDEEILVFWSDGRVWLVEGPFEPGFVIEDPEAE